MKSVRQLGDIVKIVAGSAFAISFQGRTELPTPLFKVSDFVNSKDSWLSKSANTVDVEILKALRAKTYPVGTVIFPKVGGALLTNKRARLAVEAAFDNNIMGLIPVEVDGDYLYYYMCLFDMAIIANTTSVPSVKASDVAKIEIPTPSMAQQRRIAAQLKAQLAEVDKARQAAEMQLRDIANLVAQYREEALAELGDIPRAPLGELLLGIEAGKSFKTTELPARNNELGILKVSAVSWNEFRPQEAKAVEGNYQPDEKHRVKQGDLIISRANTLELVGAVVRVEQDYPFRLLSDKTLRLVIDEEKILPDYLLTILQWPEAREHIEHNATGTSDSMRNISQKTIKSIPVPITSKRRQHDIVKKSMAINRKAWRIKTASKARLADLDILPQKILARAFE